MSPHITHRQILFRNVALIALGFGIWLVMAVTSTGDKATASAQFHQPGVVTANPTVGFSGSGCELAWRPVESANVQGLNNSIVAVSAISATDIWAVGYIGSQYQTLTMHWNGTVWNVVPSPNPGQSRSYLTDVAAVASNDVWAVGSYDNYTMILHWDGAAWNRVISPNPGYYVDILQGVTAISANNLWAVGQYTDVNSRPHTLVLHWDGSSWAQVPSPSFLGADLTYLLDVSGSSANDLWAVGDYRIGGETEKTLILHWDGSTWAVIPSPNIGPVQNRNLLFGVAALSANQAWAVGQYYDNASFTWYTLLLHWDGSAWTPVNHPNPGVDIGTALYGVTAISANDVWAVGSRAGMITGNTTVSIALHWDGSSWTEATVPQVGYASYLNSIVSLSSEDVWAVGVYSPSPGNIRQTLVQRYSRDCGPSTPTPVPLTSTPGPPTATPTPCTAGSFSDVPLGSTFYPYVNCLVTRGIISGYSDCTFLPGNNVTRGQLAKIVSNSAGFNEPVGGQTFEDVPPGSTFYTYTERLASRAVMSGYQCGDPAMPNEPCIPPGNRPYFRTNNNATRGQISKIVAKARGYETPPSTRTFEDVPPDSIFYLWIENLASRGIMNGYQCGGPDEPCIPPDNRPYFHPGNNATRGQTSKIVSKTFFPECNPPGR